MAERTTGADLHFGGVVGYGVAGAEEAAHFFEHILGLAPAGVEGSLRFYGDGGVSVAVEVSGGLAGEPPLHGVQRT